VTDNEQIPDRTGPIVLGYTPMDEVHAEFHEVLERATRCTDAEFPQRLQAVVDHLKSHFATEDRWMDETNFPPGDCHRDEHAAVLKSAAEVLALEPDALILIGRDFVRELTAWFPGHADHLDSALAAWMFKRLYGGKPVVLHRRIPGQG
jgi:hemerythrin